MRHLNSPIRLVSLLEALLPNEEVGLASIISLKTQPVMRMVGNLGLPHASPIKFLIVYGEISQQSQDFRALAKHS
jgi:hypothetical protein